MKSITHATSLAALAFSCSSFALSAAAQDQDSDNVTLEEITVTAQKREQGLQDVPISVSAVSGARINDVGIQDFNELAALVPNFQVNEDPIGDKVNIRGIQSGNNAGIEQSIGTYVDGVYRGRGIQSRFAFLDPERIEVLRGPQGTLFGKNTIGGALNITSAKPTDEFSGEIGVTYNFDFDEIETTGYLSGPLSDRVRARVAWLYRDMNEGWLDNLHYGTTTPQREEWAVRGIIEVDVSENTLVTARYERGDFDQFGQPFGTITAGPLAAFGVESGSFDTTNMGNSGFPAFGFGPFFDFGANGTLVGDSDEASLTVEHSFDNGNTLTIIAAHSKYDFVRLLDADFSNVPGIRFDDTEDYEQTSVEVRLASDTDGPLEYIVGAYYQDYNLVADGDAFFNVPFFNTILNAGCAGAGVDPLQFAADLGAVSAGDLSGAPGLIGAAATAGSAAAYRQCILGAASTNPFTGGPLDGFNRYHFLDMDSETFAAFAQATYDLSDRMRFTGGLRYTREKKTATQGAFGALLGTRTRTDDPLTLFLLDALGEATPHEFTPDDLSRTENNLDWSANLQFDASDDVMVYASASTGFKAGGFNSFALRDDPSEAEFEDEKVISFEIGAKATLAGGRAELNVAAFHTKFDDLQTALFTGSTSFIVQNAAQATIKGIEIDGRFQVTENLMLTASAGYLDFEFDEFPNAGCTADQLLALREDTFSTALANVDLLGLLGAAQLTLQDCAALEINDLAGRPSEHAPQFTFSGSANHSMTIGDYEVNTIVDLVWQDEQFRQADLDPILKDEAFARVNATMVVGPVDGNWDIALLVKNLFDNDMFIYGNDTPLFDGARQFIAGQPRSISVRARVRF